MLAENFSKEFYKNINEWVNNSTNGVVGEFADLESERDNVEIDVWQLNWVKINPTLVDIDLRPYLFITRDRKTSYGVISQLGDLENLADNLLGSSMVVAGLEGKVKELSTQDAKKILEHIGVHISQQIIVKKKEPEGWSGLLMLTKYHSDLQSHLCTFLSTIDDKKIGSWAVKPIDVFTNLDAKKLYLELLGQWHDQKENKTLSTYAGRVLSPKGKK